MKKFLSYLVSGISLLSIVALSKLEACNYSITACLLGKSCVGKTSISNALLSIEYRDEDLRSTIGFDCKTLRIKDGHGNRHDITIFDTAGTERYQAISKQYLRDVDIGIIVFSLDDEDSLRQVEYFKKMISENNANIFKIILICNKSDCSDGAAGILEQMYKKITDHELLRISDSEYIDNSNNTPLFLVSAKSDHDVGICKLKELLLTYSLGIHDKVDLSMPKTLVNLEGVSIDDSNNKNTDRKCCKT